MSEGNKAAEQVKGGFKSVGDLGESIRSNINSFADDLLGGNKTHESTGFSNDAKALGREVEKGAETAGQKADNTTSAPGTTRMGEDNSTTAPGTTRTTEN
ncbi:unnamed protein product [Zymoseptoria tritici ST99CH_1A5]|uniref:Uncharacterized protein n=2 Tax=Zymoseptoria tritici TaxID=1047171 RepID=A0A2H1FZT9_ZYMTR|nr:unnamed protein product [Zymoseptoria tritici ST99CH_1E4]SMR48056.1 unnamed protein product [Zymoseptoria tritici ST99CH_3D1]SMY21964.1 unnamed protein product [Zymoseptoria tritici ST99CH_1A5]